MKKHKRVDLNSLSDAEKAKLMCEIRRQILQKVMEEKLTHSLLNVEPSAINKEMVRRISASLNGIVPREVSNWLRAR
jgi:hypothetical protein